MDTAQLNGIDLQYEITGSGEPVLLISTGPIADSFFRARVAGHSTGAVIALQLASDRPEIVHSLALLEPPLTVVPSAGTFFEKAGPALSAYGSGDRAAAMAAFLSLVGGLDWEACRTLLEKRIPGSVA